MIFKINSKKHGTKIILIDEEDYDRINKLTWCVHKTLKTTFYVYNAKEKISLHRYILNPPKHKIVDHINHDTLDNRKCNLRICTQKENQANQVTRKKSSIFKGVYWNNKRKRFIAQLRTSGKSIYIGYFKDEKEAAIAYNKIFAILNY